LVSPFRRLLGYVRPYRRDFLLGLTCVVGTTGIALTAPWVLKHAVDDLTAGVTRGKLALYGSGLLAIGLVGGVFRFLMRRILVGVSRQIEYDMRNDFFAQLERMPAAYFQARRTGDFMSRATNDLNAVRQMVGPAVMYSANTLLGFVRARRRGRAPAPAPVPDLALERVPPRAQALAPVARHAAAGNGSTTTFSPAQRAREAPPPQQGSDLAIQHRGRIARLQDLTPRGFRRSG
jgi:ABC-type multidrug transport system fused ATPase/permease subunit